LPSASVRSSILCGAPMCALICLGSLNILTLHALVFFFSRSDQPLDLHSFPTRRSSDLRSSLYTWIDAKTAFPIQGLEAVANVLRVRASELVARAEHRSRTHRSVTPAGQ